MVAWVRIILGYDIPCKVFAAFDPSEKLVSHTHTITLRVVSSQVQTLGYNPVLYQFAFM